jgi:hypothetical protein
LRASALARPRAPAAGKTRYLRSVFVVCPSVRSARPALGHAAACARPAATEPANFRKALLLHGPRLGAMRQASQMQALIDNAG